jgi:hypothetical protein
MLIAVLIATVIIAIFLSPPVEFLTPAEFGEVAARQPYFQQMTPADLRARSHTQKFNDASSYLAWYRSNVLDWTWWEHIQMRAVVAEADRAMHRRGLVQYIPQHWLFAKVARAVEQGFPHTHADVIVWSEDTLQEPFWEQVKLAVHEAVHVWQRQNPDAARLAHIAQGFRPLEGELALRRNNPDTDTTVWQRAGETYTSCYRTARPTDLVDVENADHPHEQQAYAIADFAMS